jgi:hypothetical protein
MKIALYIEDGVEQVVLTPQSSTEKAILAKLHDGSRNLQLYRGAFYGCRGGWTRWQEPPAAGQFHRNGIENDDNSTILVLLKKEETASA